jgi:hypothetical protein
MRAAHINDRNAGRPDNLANPTQIMNPTPLWNSSTRVRCGRGRSSAVLLLAACALMAISANAAQSRKSMVKPPVAVPGGLDNHPYVTAITPEPTNGTATVEWFGIVGPFELEGKEGLFDETWESLGTTTSREATLPMADASGFLRVKAPDANFRRRPAMRALPRRHATPNGRKPPMPAPSTP